MAQIIEGTINRDTDACFCVLLVRNPFTNAWEYDCSTWRKPEAEAMQRAMNREGIETDLVLLVQDDAEFIRQMVLIRNRKEGHTDETIAGGVVKWVNRVFRHG